MRSQKNHAVFLSLTLAALMVVPLAPIHSAPDKKPAGLQIMTYDVYAGGIHVLRAELDINTARKGKYGIELSAQTFGFLGRLVPWQGSFVTQGWREKNARHRPELHISEAVWQDEAEYKEYRYGRNGTFKGLTVTENGKTTTEQPDKKLTHGTTDALSVALESLTSVALGKGCTASGEVFDGKRRFKQVFSDDGSETLKATRYNVYNGEAVKCIVEVTPAGGAWHKKPRGWLSIQEQGRQAGALPTMWVAKLSETGPAVPVKIQIKTSYGTLMMHLTGYQSGGKTLLADKRGK